MVKRSGADVVAAASRGHALPSPGLKEAPVLELMCSHFVLTLAAKEGLPGHAASVEVRLGGPRREEGAAAARAAPR